jgi:hypothetical protein
MIGPQIHQVQGDLLLDRYTLKVVDRGGRKEVRHLVRW